MVYAFTPQQRFEMHLGWVTKPVFRRFVVSGVLPALQQPLLMPPWIGAVWKQYSRSWWWTKKEFGSFVRCAKLGKKYLNVFGQVLTELRERLKFRSKKPLNVKCCSGALSLSQDLNCQCPNTFSETTLSSFFKQASKQSCKLIHKSEKGFRKWKADREAVHPKMCDWGFLNPKTFGFYLIVCR